MFRQYVNLAASLRREVDLSLALEPQRVLGSGSLVLARGSAAAPQLSIPASGPPQLLLGHGSSTRGQQQPGQLQSSARTGAAVAAASGAVSAPAAASGSNSQGARGGRPAHVSVLGSGTVIKAEDGSEVPQQVCLGSGTIHDTFEWFFGTGLGCLILCRHNVVSSYRCWWFPYNSAESVKLVSAVIQHHVLVATTCTQA